MNEVMVQRVMDELRPVYPHDDEEMLRATATKTTLGAFIAIRLAFADLGRALAGTLKEQARHWRRLRDGGPR